MPRVRMKPPRHLHQALLLCAALLSANTHAQRARYWTGGSGNWSDPAHWSLVPGGPGGAGAPRASENALFRGTEGTISVHVADDARCHDLLMDAGQGTVILEGDPSASLTLGGELRLTGAVDWRFTGPVVCSADQGTIALGTNGIPVSSDFILDGSGTWELRSALVLTEDADLVLKHGALNLNDGVLRTGGLRTEGRALKRITTGNAYVITGSMAIDMERTSIEDGGTMLMVGGQLTGWSGTSLDVEALRGITNCATGAGQTPFQVNAFVTSDYNGFGVSCNGACDGAVNVAVTGGIGPFSLQWQGGPNGTGTSLPWANLCSGNKLVIVTDLGQNVGCFASALISPPPPLGVVFFGLTPPSCANVCNGTAVTFPGGGVGINYTYNWNNGTESSSNPSQLCAGVNTLQLTDDNGCLFDTAFTIDLEQLVATLTFADGLCAGDCEGTAHVDITGGTPDYDYAWEPGTPAGDGTADVTALCAGNWSVHVSDLNGCDTTITFTIGTAPPIVPNLTITPASCSNGCDGTAGVAPTGGTGPFTYEWEPGAPPGDGTAAVTGLCPGDWTVLITDTSIGCDTLVSFTIDAPLALDVQLITTDATCSGSCDGTGSITINGGTPGYVIVWSPGAIIGQGTPSATQLCAGAYTVTVSDAAGCDTTIQFTIGGPDPIGANAVITDISCNGACDGAIILAPTGGTPGYTYAWSPTGGNGPGISSLCAGTWTATITDAAGCDTTFSVGITEPQPLEAELIFTDAGCVPGCDGTASVVATGGTPDLVFDWSGTPTGDGTPDVSGLCGGAWNVVVSDQNGCDTTIAFTIGMPPPIDPALVVTDATCANTCDGSATVAPVGGPFTYDWEPGTINGDGSNAVADLCAGAYTVLITDPQSGCDTLVPFVVGSAPALDVQLTATDLTCNGGCDGTATLAINGGTPGFVITWGPGIIIGQGTPNATQLCAGAYTVTVSDAAGCDTTIQFTINGTVPIEPNITATNVTCNGYCNGTITASPSGGIPGYTYVWSPPPTVGDSTASVSVLCAGIWTVTITDAAGCDTTVSTGITEPDPLEVTFAQTGVGCSGDCDATASVTVAGGTPGYTYDWSGSPVGDSTSAVTGLCPGVYTVQVQDAVPCGVIQTFIIAPPVPITVDVTTQDASCAGACDGAAEAVATGGTGVYAYAWWPGGQTTADVTGLCAMDHLLTVSDSSGCDTTITVSIAEPLPIDPVATVSNVGCSGACDGSIVLAPVGGSGNYTYAWSNGSSGNQVQGLCAGTVTVTVSDGACDTTLVFDITEPDPLNTGLNILGAGCGGACTGTASAVPTGGTPGYDFTWGPGTIVGQGTPNASQLCPGAYTLVVVDSIGCDTTISFTIEEPAAIMPAVITTLAGCGGACDGTATLDFTGGAGMVTIVWSPQPGSGQGTVNATGMCPGPGIVTLTDSLGCDTTVQFIIGTPSGIVVVPTVEDASCANACDGSVELSASGGAPGYSFNWTPAVSTDSMAAGLCQGQYIVQVGDQAGCDTTVVVDVGAPPPISITGSFTNESCFGPCDGTASVTAAGGSGPIGFTWSPTPGTDDGNGNVTGLCAGEWTVTATDAAGCDTSWTFTLLPQQPIAAELAVEDGTCAGTCSGTASVNVTGGSGTPTYDWAPGTPAGDGTNAVTGLCLGTHSVTITDAAGCDTTIAFVINIPPAIAPNLSVSAADCSGPCSAEAVSATAGGTPGYTWTWQPEPGGGQGTASVTGLCADTTYSLIITDAQACETVVNFTVPGYTPLSTATTTTFVNCYGTCDGNATLNTTGGTGPYTFDWTPDPQGGDGNDAATGLCADFYSVLITDANGCDTTVSLPIGTNGPITVQPVITPIACNGDCNGSIQLNATGGSGVLTYLWGPSPTGQGTDIASQLCAGQWTVTITDGLGCDTTFVFSLAEPPPMVIQAEVSASQCQACDGSITMHASGGGGGYFFAWGPPINVTTSDSVQSGLCAGIYTVIVGDALGCVTQLAVPVSDSNTEVLTVTDGSVTCPTDCNGAVSVALNCSVPSCTIAWFDGIGTNLNVSTNTMNGLCAGNYLVQVTNGDGCLNIDTAVVVAPDPIVATLGLTSPGCADMCDGTSTGTVTGGQGPWTVTWDPAPLTGQGSTDVTGLCATTYQLTIEDDQGCTVVQSVNVPGPSPIQTNATVQDITCAGACDGGIALNATGGTGTLGYSWSPGGQSTPTVTQLCAGDWSVTIIDANGCDTAFTFTLTEPVPLALTTTATPSQCLVCAGTVSVDVSGGTGTPTIVWTDMNGGTVGTGSTVTNLCAGIYTATVQDVNGCSTQAIAVVGDATGEMITVTDGVTSCPDVCDGTVSVSFACVNGPCSILWADMNGQLLAQNQFGIGGLCADNYLVQVVNGAGCTVVDTATVIAAPPIHGDLIISAPSCPGSCDGTATVLPNGPGFSIDWGPGTIIGDGTPTASGLCPGTYTVHLDNGNCDTTLTVVVPYAVPISVIGQVSGASCPGACDGSVSVSASGGTGTLGYFWDPAPQAGQGTNSATGFCPGDVVLVISDSLGCDTTLVYTVTEPQPLILVTSSTMSTCDVCSGTMTATPTGGTPGYTWSWSLAGAQLYTDSAVVNVCAGLYLIMVTDANGCQTSQAVPVSDVGAESITVTDGITTCPQICDGTMSVAFDCQVPMCSIAWYDVLANDLQGSGNTMDSMCAGQYFVQVTNGLGCIAIDTVHVIAPQPVTAVLAITQPTCADACDGEASVVTSGGAGPYTYDWSPDTLAGDGTDTITGLCAGNYMLTVMDSLGCAITIDVPVPGPPPIQVQALLTHVSCNGACDGGIALYATGGTGPLEFQWTPDPGPPQGTDSLYALCPGDWSVTITDSTGCSITAVYTIIEPLELTTAIATVDNLCQGDCAGSVTATIGGGTVPYTIVWLDAGGAVIAVGDSALNGLCAGDYGLQVTDSAGCMVTNAFSIQENPAITAALTVIGETCHGPCDGTASIITAGGTGDHVVSWADGNGNVFATDTTAVGGLCAGNWSVTITDSLGCDSVFAFTILPWSPILPNEAVQQVSCNGACDGAVGIAATGGAGTLVFTWDPAATIDSTGSASGLCPGAWNLTITGAAGCDTTITVNITEPPAITITVDDVTDASCNSAFDGAVSVTLAGGTGNLSASWSGPGGFVSGSDDIGSLQAGSYLLTVTDGNNCTVQQAVSVAALTTVVAVAGADVTLCSGGTTILDGSSSQGAVQYTWTDGQGATMGTQAQLDPGSPPPGVWTFILTVTNGPCSDADTVSVTILSSPFADAGVDQYIFIDGVVGVGGQPAGPQGSAFLWSPDSLLTDATVSNPEVSPPSTTWYVLMVTSPEGCVNTDSVLVTVVPEITIPTGFTPNGDGYNDTWVIDYMDRFPDCTVEIYNRWGEQLFRSVGYNTPWDGRYAGGLVPVGTYYYAIELNDERFPEPYTGPLTVIR